MPKQSFNLPYIGVDKSGPYDLLIGAGGEVTILLQFDNPVVRYSASPAAYEDFHQLLSAIIKVLGDGYILQKLDVIFKKPYTPPPANEYLQQKYNAHFSGRPQLHIQSYLVLTRPSFRPKQSGAFRQTMGKVLDLLPGATVLKEQAVNELMMRLLAMDFKSPNVALDNLRPGDTDIGVGSRAIRCLNLINTDSVDLPTEVGNYIELNDKEAVKGFPVDFMSFLFSVPDTDLIVFNQVIEIPNQFMTLKKLELKKKRHSGIPDPANQLCVEDIDLLLNDVARENQLLVNSHFSIVIAARQEQLQKATNYIESSLFQLGIMISRNAYNQLELFRCALPGNAVELKDYDWFLTTCDAAICFFLKESTAKDDPSDFLVRFTDHEGIPIAIDLADLPRRTNRINNLNKFICGPSGSGKSFLTNSLIEQYLLYNMDVVIVDVGHSYSGLCAYYKGKYITYSEEKPITMNPFLVNETEYNIEKKDFLVTLIALLWKGPDGFLSTVERDVIAQVISAYYQQFFGEKTIPELSFNSFYEFALDKLPEVKRTERIPFDIDEFRYVLKKFYRGGVYDSILNEAADESLFGERFIVYEIDNVQNNKALLPIVTLILMDVFIQKMRHRKNRRKALILEEAWRALTSPIMAGFLLYLVKTVRKFWGELIPVTQELRDILGNPILKDSLLSNIDTIFLLDQTKFKDNYESIAQLLSLDVTEQRKIFSINQLDQTEGRSRFKGVYIKRGATGEVYGVEVSLEQYLTYTTDKPEKSAVEQYTGRYGNYAEGLDAFVADFKASGLSLSSFINKVNQS